MRVFNLIPLFCLLATPVVGQTVTVNVVGGYCGFFVYNADGCTDAYSGEFGTYNGTHCLVTNNVVGICGGSELDAKENGTVVFQNTAGQRMSGVFENGYTYGASCSLKNMAPSPILACQSSNSSVSTSSSPVPTLAGQSSNSSAGTSSSPVPTSSTPTQSQSSSQLATKNNSSTPACVCHSTTSSFVS